jgi:hypothetical protein
MEQEPKGAAAYVLVRICAIEIDDSSERITGS